MIFSISFLTFIIGIVVGCCIPGWLQQPMRIEVVGDLLFVYYRGDIFNCPLAKAHIYWGSRSEDEFAYYLSPKTGDHLSDKEVSMAYSMYVAQTRIQTNTDNLLLGS